MYPQCPVSSSYSWHPLLVTSSFKDLLPTSSFLFLVVRPGATSSVRTLLVAMPFAPPALPGSTHPPHAMERRPRHLRRTRSRGGEVHGAGAFTRGNG